MPERRRFTQTEPLEKRLTAEAARLRKEARGTSPGIERDRLVRRASYVDDLGSAVHYALETTHAISVCPFHLDLTIRVGDDAAESHAFARQEARQERWYDVGE